MEGSKEDQSENSVQVEDKETSADIDECAAELRDIYNGTKVLTGEIKKEDNKDSVTKNMPKVALEKLNIPNLSKVLAPDLNTDLNLNEASLDLPNSNVPLEVEIHTNNENFPINSQSEASEILQDEENVSGNTLLLNNRQRKKRSKKLHDQNFPGMVRRSERLKEKQNLINSLALQQNIPPCSNNSTLVQNKVQKVEKNKLVMKNSQATKEKKGYVRKPILKRKNLTPISFTTFRIKNGKRFFEFKCETYRNKTIHVNVAEEDLTVPMKFLLQYSLKSTLADINNSQYCSSNSLETITPTDVTDLNLDEMDLNPDESIQTILGYRNIQEEVQSKYISSFKKTTQLDFAVKLEMG